MKQRSMPPSAWWAGFRPAAPALTAGLALLALAFYREGAAAVATWWESTAYNHGFLVLPIAFWLLWERRAMLVGAVARPWPPALLAALPLAVMWFAAERLGIMEGRQLAAMALAQVLLAATLGRDFYRRLLWPALYLFFLVPFGGFLVPALQNFTLDFINHGLDLLGIPHFSDGFSIEIPEGKFYVAEACAGLRFLVASIAFGALYAGVMYRSTGRRLVFVLASLIVPVLANGMRALGIVVLGHVIGSARAATADHLIYGWGFFAFVTFVLILGGLPFREPIAGGVAPAASEPVRRSVIWPGVALGLLALAAPLAALALDRTAAAAGVRFAVAAPTGCIATSGEARPALLAAANGAALGFLCAGGEIRVTLAVLPARTEPGLVLRVMRVLTGEAGADDAVISPLPSKPWRLIATRAETEAPFRVTAAALWIAGAPTRPGFGLRLRQGLRSLRGGAGVPLIAVLAPDHAVGEDEAASRLRAFLASAPDLAADLAEASAAAR